MMISKIQNKADNYKIKFFYYNRARDAMYDLVSKLVNMGYKDIYLPGYIGWSPKEGSGIFDPLNDIKELKRHYYRVTKNLYIDFEHLNGCIEEHSLLLLVNYFGFRDPSIKGITESAHKKDCIVIEDNAHGFYTYFCKGKVGTDATFFSLHKMFPFSSGGGLLIENNDLSIGDLNDLRGEVKFNPFEYNYYAIADVRVSNFRLYSLAVAGKEKWFVPLRSTDSVDVNIPQTFPIVIKRGNRDKIYEIMNEEGYGVVSLYHTMIDELRGGDNSDAVWLSRRIMNLPLHQDVDSDEIIKLVESLERACRDTEK